MLALPIALGWAGAGLGTAGENLGVVEETIDENSSVGGAVVSEIGWWKEGRVKVPSDLCRRSLALVTCPCYLLAVNSTRLMLMCKSMEGRRNSK